MELTNTVITDSSTTSDPIRNVINTFESLNLRGSGDGEAGKIHSDHTFSETIANVTIYFSVTKYANCTFLWIGTQEGSMNNLAVSMPTPYDRAGLPAATQIIGTADHTQSNLLASKLCKKMKKPFFASYNVPDLDPRLNQEVDRRLFEEISISSDKF